MAGEKLVKLIQQGARGAIPPTSLTDLTYGTVTDISPIKISIEDRFEVDSSCLLLSPFCYEKKLTVEVPAHTHTVTINDHNVSKHKHKLDDETKETQENDDVTLKHSSNISEGKKTNIQIVVWEGLKVGDKVSLLRVSEGQKFYVLDKGGSSDTTV
ncbi:MAG: DUF2577 family protein [Clostridium sp.]